MNPKIWKELNDANYDTETLTCLALAQLYDDPREGVNNFILNSNWRKKHESKIRNEPNGGDSLYQNSDAESQKRAKEKGQEEVNPS